MDWAFLLVLQFISWSSLSALFTVEVERQKYEAEFQGQVTLGCRFQPVPTSRDLGGLVVTWHRVSDTAPREVLRFENGAVNHPLQDARYRGRVQLLQQELRNGLAKLQISNLQINDSGTYRCLVQANAADYKTITLSVQAPYKSVTKNIQSSVKGERVQLTCQSEGYPLLPVTWTDGNLQKLTANHSTVVTDEQLFQVTSQIEVSSSEKNNYTCSFMEDGPSARFDIPDEILPNNKRKDALFIALSVTMVLVIIVAAVLSIWRKKVYREVGASSTKRSLVNSEESATASRPFHRADVENLREYLKAHYLRCYLHKEVRHHCESFCETEFPQRLQNNDGQPVSLHALLPDAGGTYLLEGNPGSGKTTVAHFLVSSWVEGPTQDTRNSPQITQTCCLELNSAHLLLLVDCGNAMGNLFQEIISQLDLGEKIQTEEDLRTVLNTSKEMFLLLDGYREGNQILDKSLETFLSEKKECRTLILACPGHCLRIKERVGPAGVLKLLMRTHEN